MNNKLDKFLPLGSVVLLKGAKRYIVITGYLMVEDGEQKKVWDYMGCAYPIGSISPENALMFDAKQIDKIIFEGFSDEEGETFRKKIYESIGVEK